MSQHDQTLLQAFVNSLETGGVEEGEITLLSAIATRWIDVLRRHPHQLTKDELTEKTAQEVTALFDKYFDLLWTLVTDPDQGFGRMGGSERPFLIE